MTLAHAHGSRLQQVRQEIEMTTATAPTTLDRHWPAEGVTRVPFWAYSDLQVYEQEISRIFCGESWAYVGLEVEIPCPGDFKQATIGDRPVVMARDEAGAVHVFVNSNLPRNTACMTRC
jgi:salicylate 5-hydroxylase large subunit